MLIFDIVHKLVSSFMGKDVELILLILKSKLLCYPAKKCCMLFLSNALLSILSTS